MERFIEFTVGDVVSKDSKVFVVTESATVQEIIKVLSSNHVHSVPVMSVNGNLLGFVDYLDVLSFLVEDITNQSISSGGSVSQNIKTDDLNQLMTRASRFNAANVMQAALINRGVTNPTVVLQHSATVKDAMELFGRGVHRIGVANGNSIVAILTQNSIISWLLARPERLGSMRGTPIKDLGWTREKKGPAVTVSSSDIVIDAFLTVKRNFRTGLPSVDENGVFVGYLSTTDLKLLKDNNFSMLLKDVHSFLRDTRSSGYSSKSFKVSCTETSSLGEVVEKMAHERVHAVAIIDKAGKLETVVTLTDVIRALLKMPFTY